MLNKEQLAAAFGAVGLGPGDLVLVHSSLRKLGQVEGGADAVLDALLEVIGPQGTLALPTHTWRVVNEEQPVFHQALTPSNVGAMTNIFRKRPGVIRGLHPTHSIAAFGPRAAELVEGHERDDTPCSATSPYGRLRDWGGKILIIGEGLNCCTLFHGCEQWAGMPWAVRAQTTQLFSITTGERMIPVPMHSHFVNTWDQYPRLEPALLAAGAMRLGQVGECPLRLLDARAAADLVVDQLRRDPGIILPDVLPAEFPGSQQEAGQASPPPALQIGWAAADLTPEQPVQLAGQFHARVSEGVLDPLTATALVLSNGNGPDASVVLVSCDLLAFPDSLRRAVRRRLAVSLPDLDPAAVLFNATHTHTAPEVRLADEYAKTGGGISSSGNCVELPAMPERDYEAFAAERIAQAVADAWAARAPGTISHGLGHAVIGHNRRSCTYGGESRMYGDTSSADFSHIEGGEDPDVNILATWDATGQMTGLVVNVACPAQVGELLFQISADYWHEARVELRRRFGGKLFVLPQCSAAGDLSPHRQIGKAAEERMLKLAGRTTCQEIAVRIADAISAILPVLKQARDGNPVLRHRTVSVQLPWRPLSDADLQMAQADVDRLRQDYERLRRELEANPEARREPRWYVPVTGAYRMMKWQECVLKRPAIQREIPSLPVEVQVFQVGDIVFASNPFELFLDFGVQIKARSPAIQTFLVQLAGGGTYVPTARSLAGNSYGALPASTPVGPEGGRILVDITVNNIVKLIQK